MEEMSENMKDVRAEAHGQFSRYDRDGKYENEQGVEVQATCKARS